MTHKDGKKVYYTDFDRLEKTNYKSLTKFAKEIVDKIVEISTGEKPERTPEVQAKIDLVMEGFRSLTDKQRTIIEYSFGLNDKPVLTLREAAAELGITFQGAHELKKRALTALSKCIVLEESAIKNIKK